MRHGCKVLRHESLTLVDTSIQPRPAERTNKPGSSTPAPSRSSSFARTYLASNAFIIVPTQSTRPKNSLILSTSILIDTLTGDRAIRKADKVESFKERGPRDVARLKGVWM
jgi:hypothetical protein